MQIGDCLLYHFKSHLEKWPSSCRLKVSFVVWNRSYLYESLEGGVMIWVST